MPTRVLRGRQSLHLLARETEPGLHALEGPFHLALKLYPSLIQAPPASYPQVILKHDMFGVMEPVGGTGLPSLAQLVLHQ